MKSFRELCETTLTSQQRYQKRRTLQRYKWKTSRRREIQSGVGASSKRNARRTELAAKRMLYKQLLHGIKKSSLSSTAKASYERQIKSRAKFYEKGIAHNLGPKKKRTDTLRLHKQRHG